MMVIIYKFAKYQSVVWHKLKPILDLILRLRVNWILTNQSKLY